MHLLLSMLALLLFMVSYIQAVPPVLNYAGQVAVNGQPFKGEGLFKFALVNTDGKITYWSNDGTSVNGSEPQASLKVLVSGGLYSLLLGNTAIPGMGAINPQIFVQHSDANLRVWFSDGVNGFQQLSPDRPFASVPYAFSAGTVQSAVIANGSISSAMLRSDVIADLNATIGMNRLSSEVIAKLDQNTTVADGSITSSKIANNTIATSDLNQQILKYLKPEIIAQPQTLSVLADSNTSFSFSAEGKYLSYQWKKNGNILTGETNSTLIITDANATLHDGNYSVVVTNEFGNVESNASEFLVINPNAISQGLVGWWPLDGNASDMSGNGNDGNVTGAIHPNSRKLGGAYYFNGVDNSINLGNSAILNPTQSMSLSAWFKIFDGKVRGFPIIERYSATVGQRSFLLKCRVEDAYNRILFSVHGNSSLSTNREKIISYNTYYHTVGTYDSNSITCLYLDGQLCSSQAVSSPIVASQTNTTIGGWMNSYENFFHGIIYDVRIYDRALTAAEVQALYNLGH